MGDVIDSINEVNSRYRNDIGLTRLDCKHQGFSWNSLMGRGRYTCRLRLGEAGNCKVKGDSSECDRYEIKE